MIASFIFSYAATRAGICSSSKMLSGITAAQTAATAPSAAMLAWPIGTRARSPGVHTQIAHKATSGGSSAGTRIDNPPGSSKHAAPATNAATAEIGKSTPAVMAAHRGTPALMPITVRMLSAIHTSPPARIVKSSAKASAIRLSPPYCDGSPPGGP